MTNLDRLAEYEICQKRGHIIGDKHDISPEGHRLFVCEYCDTAFRDEYRLIEYNAPIKVKNRVFKDNK